MIIRDKNTAITYGGYPISLNFSQDLEFTMRGTTFPASDDNINGRVRFSSRGSNKCFVDYQDGTPIKEFLFENIGSGNTQLNFLNSNSVGGNNLNMHYYQDLEDISKIGTIDNDYPQERKVIISFEKPENVYVFQFFFARIWGAFPSEIGRFNLDVFHLERTFGVSSFPSTFAGGKFRRVTLSSIGSALSRKLPDWIFSSEIEDLNLEGSIDLSGNFLSNGFYQVYQVKNLKKLFVGNNNLSDVPETLHLSVTLSDLDLLNFKGSEITENIKKITQLKSLNIGGLNSTIVRWPSSMSGLYNLESISYSSKYSNVNLMETKLFNGIENIKWKTIDAYSTFSQTQKRTDDHIQAWYNACNQFGGKTSSVNVLRGIKFIYHYHVAIYATQSLRPSGIFQAPSGYVQGSSNGSPTTAMEMIYCLVKQYNWTITVKNEAGNGAQIYAP